MALAVVAVHGLEAPEPPLRPTARAALQDCRLEGFPFSARCGTVEVVEDRAARRGRRIGLRVVVLPPQKPFPSSDPLFYLAGGPGLAATQEARAIAPLLAELAEARPVVLVDLRGRAAPMR